MTINITNSALAIATHDWRFLGLFKVVNKSNLFHFMIVHPCSNFIYWGTGLLNWLLIYDIINGGNHQIKLSTAPSSIQGTVNCMIILLIFRKTRSVISKLSIIQAFGITLLLKVSMDNFHWIKPQSWVHSAHVRMNW